MQANIIAVDQRFDFNTKVVLSYAVFLINGKEVRAELHSLEDVKALLGVGMEEAVLPPEESPSAEPQVTSHVSAEVEEVEEGDNPLVRWEDVEEDLITPEMKRALKAVGAPEVMKLTALHQLINDIIERFNEDGQLWALGNSPPRAAPPGPGPPSPRTVHQAPPPSVPVPPAAVVGQVVWANGRPILPGVGSRGRTVQKDDLGYPIVDNGGVDPGEIVGTGDDVDEDGVGQM